MRHNNVKVENNQSLKSYTAKISGVFNSIPFSGTLRLQKDSVIWVSVSSLGFEVARLLLREDSVFALNKLEKEVLIGDYKTFEKQFGLPLSFSIAQKALLDTSANTYNSAQQQIEIEFLPKGVTTIEHYAFPQQLTTKAKLRNKSKEIIIKFSNQQVNLPIQTPFSIPDNYTHIN
ncbi:MAG: DUF4292 domain-containing protein [Bacteroidales bacterium]|jgi:hypothetical protein|nr:DUF4292 domain-containing protein [Bacteroidales bacterium]